MMNAYEVAFHREQIAFYLDVMLWAVITSGLAAIMYACLAFHKKMEYVRTIIGVGIFTVAIHAFFIAFQYVQMWSGMFSLFAVLILSYAFVYAGILIIRLIRAIH